MLPTQQGSIKLFRFAGIQVFLHWSWFVVAVYEVNTRGREYSSIGWNILEYLTLFAIVLMHEFGHSLACRSVGGTAERIVLWPLGGVAYVSPPPRPGATLWSIAAGPLVNVILAPILTLLYVMSRRAGLDASAHDLYLFIQTVCYINYLLLIFNLMPIFPLDGGQILRSLLWFPLGRARSLMIVVFVGFAGVAALIGLAVFAHSVWIGIMAVFILLNCWRGLMQARLLAKVAKLPRRSGFACPVCREPPVLGSFWRCAQCLKPFDTFETNAQCPHCGAVFPTTRCPECGNSSPLSDWAQPFTVPPKL
ncbi:MAG: site-2 protease family protein [Limisphaerales bacterium]